MKTYIGSTCPVCHQPFAEGDDIVVCPDCGTPYHRACWPKDNVCVHTAEHAAGFEWQPDAPAAAEDGEPACPNCGAHNPPGAHYCNHCGVPLPEHPESPDNPRNITEDGPGRPIYENPDYESRHGAAYHSQGGNAGPAGHTAQPDDAYAPFGAGMYQKVLGPEDPIDGIKARDWSTFLGSSSIYYLLQFYRMQETGRKISTNFGALLLGPIYFFYRKMWKEGAVFAAVDLLLTLPVYLTMLVVSNAAITSGMPTGWLIAAMNITSVLSWVVMVGRSLAANYLYHRTCLHRIQAIEAQNLAPQPRQDALALRGGTCLPAALGYVAFCFAVAFVLMLLGVDPIAVTTLFGI